MATVGQNPGMLTAWKSIQSVLGNQVLPPANLGKVYKGANGSDEIPDSTTNDIAYQEGHRQSSKESSVGQNVSSGEEGSPTYGFRVNSTSGAVRTLATV
jgi:hypothetical protein